MLVLMSIIIWGVCMWGSEDSSLTFMWVLRWNPGHQTSPASRPSIQSPRQPSRDSKIQMPPSSKASQSTCHPGPSQHGTHRSPHLYTACHGRALLKNQSDYFRSVTSQPPFINSVIQAMLRTTCALQGM